MSKSSKSNGQKYFVLLVAFLILAYGINVHFYTLSQSATDVSRNIRDFDKDMERAFGYNVFDEKEVTKTNINDPNKLLTKPTTKKLRKRKKKNVIFIMTDDLRPSLSIYNVPGVQTPNFERLGKLSTTFSRAYNQGKSMFSLLEMSKDYVYKISFKHNICSI